MRVDGALPVQEREEVIFFTDGETGLRGVTVLDLALGAGTAKDDALGSIAVGACRSRPYIEENRGLADALRQAHTTTTKARIAGLPVVGGCTVLFSETPVGTRPAAPMPAIGRAVDRLDGRYRLMPDLQGDLNDMEQAARGTPHVLGRADSMEINAVEATALGLRFGIEATVRQHLGRDTLMGLRIGIIGLGSVGFRLAELLRLEGAKLTVADRDPRRTERAVRALGINCVATEEIIHLDNDVLVPTAAKDTIDDGMLSHLRCKILAGGVDDPLASSELGQTLHDRGILYAPDTVINAGGLISLVQSLLPAARAASPVLRQIQAIGDRMAHVLARTATGNLSPMIVAQHLADEACITHPTTSPETLVAG